MIIKVLLKNKSVFEINLLFQYQKNHTIHCPISSKISSHKSLF
ncbi:hypothetical protein HJ01_01906 [Flavobacterium frigoris PS1]|uniref:Uncharacterized protein n=1 Tax=Flavobacterium frigoris (strain PS1) TaxID=1086011 RepID=H7FRP5_FLAFP|nr:hypothetical protein HJ01_01906 [Flavobacterium frigoris PS1]